MKLDEFHAFVNEIIAAAPAADPEYFSEEGCDKN